MQWAGVSSFLEQVTTERFCFGEQPKGMCEVSGAYHDEESFLHPWSTGEDGMEGSYGKDRLNLVLFQGDA
jgi:hypothetical protein